MKNLIQILILLINFSLFAQLHVGNVDLNFGEVISSQDGDVVKIGGEKDNTIYALANKNKKFYLQTFNAQTKKFETSTLLKFDKINGNKLEVEDLAIVGGNVYLMLSYYDNKEDTYNFMAKEIEGNEIINTTTVLSIPVKRRVEKGTFVFDLSPNDVYYLVAHVGIHDYKEKLQYNITLLNGTLGSVFKDNYEVVYDEKKSHFFDFSDIRVNEKGDVLIATTESYRDKKEKTAINNITLHSYLSKDSYEKKVTEINLSGKRALNCNLMETSDNNLHALGFYSDLKKSGRAESTVEGIYAVTIDYTNGTVIKETFNDFTFDIKKQLIGERRAKKGKDLKPFYRNIAFVERANGGVIVLSEYSLVLEGRGSGIGPLALIPYTFIANEIIVTALHKDGSLDWSNVIPKEQQVVVRELGLTTGSSVGFDGVTVSAGLFFPLVTMGSGPEYLSAIPIYHNDALTVIVNDDPKNIGITNIDDVKKVRNVNKMIPVAFSFNEDTGEISRVDPSEFEKKQIVVRPSTNLRINSSSYLIFGGNKEGNCLGELIVN